MYQKGFLYKIMWNSHPELWIVSGELCLRSFKELLPARPVDLRVHDHLDPLLHLLVHLHHIVDRLQLSALIKSI